MAQVSGKPAQKSTQRCKTGELVPGKPSNKASGMQSSTV